MLRQKYILSVACITYPRMTMSKLIRFTDSPVGILFSIWTCRQKTFFFFFFKKTNVGTNVLLLSQKCLLEFNLTHSLLLACSSPTHSPLRQVSISQMVFACKMTPPPPYLQRLFLMTLIWLPPNLQEETSTIPQFWSLSCFTALS